MANNQNVNKVVYAGNTLIDLTNDDVTAGDVLSGKKFHLASGAEATGTLPNIGAISGILKGDGAGNVSAATAGTDYLAPNALTPYRTAAAQDVIDAGKEASGLGLTGASVGDLVRVNAVDANGKPTSWKKVALNEIKCNKNLLDNWYFVGGGSQLGDGVFPINQRGQTTYQNFGTSIDRWKINSRGNLTVALESDGISLIEQGTENAHGYFDQRIADIYEQFVGKTLTATILLSNNTLITGTCVWNKTTFTIPGNGNVQLRLYWYVDVKQIGFTIDVFHTKSEKIKAAKLELGSEQTLCHNEGTEQNPVWVLNEIPNYGEELRKCQRYFERLSGAYSVIGTGYALNTTMALCVAFIKPKIKTFGITSETPINGTIYYNDATHLGSAAIAGTSFSNLSCYPDGRLQVTLRGFNGLTAGTPCMFTFRDTTSYFDISAEP